METITEDPPAGVYDGQGDGDDQPPMTQQEREATAGFDRDDDSGQSLEEIEQQRAQAAAEGNDPDDDEQDDTPPPPKVGDGKLSKKIAGGMPDTSELKLKSISRPVQGQVDDDDENAIYAFIVFGRVEETGVVRTRDGSGNVSTRTRRSTITPQSYAIVDPEVARRVLQGAEVGEVPDED